MGYHFKDIHYQSVSPQFVMLLLSPIMNHLSKIQDLSLFTVSLTPYSSTLSPKGQRKFAVIYHPTTPQHQIPIIEPPKVHLKGATAFLKIIHCQFGDYQSAQWNQPKKPHFPYINIIKGKWGFFYFWRPHTNTIKPAATISQINNFKPTPFQRSATSFYRVKPNTNRPTPVPIKTG